MGLFFYNKIGSIRSIGDLPTTNIIEPLNVNECFSFKTTFRFLILLQILEKTIKNIILYARVLKIPILFNKIRVKDY